MSGRTVRVAEGTMGGWDVLIDRYGRPVCAFRFDQREDAEHYATEQCRILRAARDLWLDAVVKA